MTKMNKQHTILRVIAALFIISGSLDLIYLIINLINIPPEYVAMPIAWQFGRYFRYATLCALSLLGGIAFFRLRNSGRIALIIFCLLNPIYSAYAFACGFQRTETPGQRAWIFGLIFSYAIAAPFLYYLFRKKTKDMMKSAQQVVPPYGTQGAAGDP